MPSSDPLWRGRLRRYMIAAAVFGLSLVVELSLQRARIGFTFLAFAPAVAVAALIGGAGPGFMVVGMSLLAADYFLLGAGRLLYFDDRFQVLALAGFAAAWSVVAAMAGLASRRINHESDLRRAAERTAAQAHRIGQSTAALGKVRTSNDTIEAATQEALHWVGADAAVFFLLDQDDRRISVARAVGHPLTAGDSWELAALGESSPFAESMARLVPVVIKSAAERQAAGGLWSRVVPWRDYETTVVLPVAVDRRVIAFLQIDYKTAREVSPEDHEYLHMLCSRAAQALNRTWWYESVERARVDAEHLKSRADAELVERHSTELALRASETRYRALATRTTRLHALTASLSEAVSVTAVAGVIVEQAHMVVGASQGELHLLVDKAASFEAGSCAAEAARERRPVFVGSFAEAQEKYWSSASTAADKGYASTAALPLLVEQWLIAVLEFHFSAPVNFDEEYQALLISVAQHCTQALDRARLYEQAQRARTEAEEANRLKDEFVSTVSHELRTPLNAILGWASMLRSGSIDEQVVPQALESVYRNASRQARLVDDLLDFSRLAGGRTTLDVEEIDAPTLIRGIVESVIPLAVGNDIKISLAPVPEARLYGDVRRLEQVFTNLLGNALKFTPAGGRIMVSARVNGRLLEVRVADDGIGIDKEFLPHVFDRFRQGDSTPTRNHPGLGLGLSIAKQLIEAHKGSIRAESAGTGKGTAFIVSLPLDRDVAPTADAKSANGAHAGEGVLVPDTGDVPKDVHGRA